MGSGFSFVVLFGRALTGPGKVIGLMTLHALISTALSASAAAFKRNGRENGGGCLDGESFRHHYDGGDVPVGAVVVCHVFVG